MGRNELLPASGFANAPHASRCIMAPWKSTLAKSALDMPHQSDGASTLIVIETDTSPVRHYHWPDGKGGSVPTICAIQTYCICTHWAS
jgi:hypothetical protein